MLRKNEEECVIPQTQNEEIANAVTHGFGFLISLFGCVYLVQMSRAAESPLYLACALFYGISLIATYTTSTVYHLARSRVKEVFRRLDHASIFLLIAGTYMPISLLVLKGRVGWTLFGIECSFAMIGITFKAIFGHKHAVLSGIVYMVMGWMAIFAIKPLVQSLPFHALVWLFSGGVFYTLGFVFFALDQRFHYFHAIWHVFVLAGSFAHFYLLSAFVFTL